MSLAFYKKKVKLNYVISIVLPGMVVVFKKLFGGKASPTKEGNSHVKNKADGVRWVKRFNIVLSNMEGSPSYGLTHQLTVGSEVGNIIIADQSVSARHCTFILQDDVVSVIDHGSINGTFINKKKITPGQYIILEDSDTIKVGDLEVQVLVQNEAVKEEIVVEESQEEHVAELVELDRTPVKATKKKAKSSKFGFLSKLLPAKKAAPAVKASGKKKTPVAAASNTTLYSANSFIRLIAVICDLLIAYILFVLFYPFDEFRIFLHDLPSMIGSLLDLDWDGLMAVLNEEYRIGDVLADVYNLIAVNFNFLPLVFLFFGVRLLSTLLFGVSASEAILGIRASGNMIWKRIGGLIRVLLGIITGPFLIFDVPAIISRRTFKEFMTFTRTHLDSTFVAIVSVILYLPLLVALALFAPLLQGLELPEPIAIKDTLDMRVKVAPVEGAAEVVKLKETSKFLNLEVNYDTASVSLIPMFKFSGEKKKINYSPSFVMYQKDLQRGVQVEVFKTFDFKGLLGIAIKGDYFLQEKFPFIDGFVNASDLTKTAFKPQEDEKSSRKFADEVVAMTKLAFEMSATNALDNMQAYTPFIKGLMDYRSSFLSLCEYKEFDLIDFIKLGNAYFLRLSYNRQKPFDLIIPLIKGDGRIFKIEFDKKENLGALKTKFYKFSLNGSNWFPAKIIENNGETLTPFQVLDFFSQINFKGEVINAEKAQALYGYYFEKSAEILKKEDATETELWRKSVESAFTIMEKMKSTAVTTRPVTELAPNPEGSPEVPVEAVPAEADPRIKLFQNFQDLKDAVENKNKEFFGIQSSSTI